MERLDARRALGARSAFARWFDRTDYILALVIFAMLFVLFTSFKLTRSDQMYSDSAMYLQATENIAARGVAVSQVQGSAAEFIYYSKFLTATAEQIAKDPLPLFGRPIPSPPAERDLLLGHTYFILYPIAVLVKLFPVRVVLMSLDVLSFTGMVLLAYFALRAKGVGIVGSSLFCLLIVAQPTWWEGLLWGQFYPDRLFLLAGFLLMLLASRSDTARPGRISNRTCLFIAAVVCASINERGALVSGIFLIAHVVLYWQKPGLDRRYRLILGAGLLGLGLIFLKVLLATKPEYSNFFPASPRDFLYLLEQPVFAQNIILFLVVNAPLLCLAAFEWRAAAIAAFLMLPNIFGNIGGAEKTGWSTHYPSFFFPSLVWAAFSGYVALSGKATTRRAAMGMYVLTGLLILFLCMLNPNSPAPLSISLANVSNGFVARLHEQIDLYVSRPEPRESLERQAAGISEAIPPGTIVSTIELGMPLLYRNRTIEFFPADIDHADYVVLGAQMIAGKISYNGAVSYLGPTEAARITDLAVSRMKLDGYDVDHPEMFPAYDGLAIVRRVR